MKNALPIPNDAARSHEMPGVACGHGALAAAIGCAISDVLPRLKPDGWVNYPMMLEALVNLGIRSRSHRDTIAETPHDDRGVCLIQWAGPWCDPGRPPAARCQHRHWIAMRENLVWDINAPDVWTSIADWADFMPANLMPPRATGWAPFRSLTWEPKQ